MKKIIVINKPSHWGLDIPGVDVISPRRYLSDSGFSKLRNVRVFNLSNDYAYQTRGYYVSLLAEARGHKVVPSVKNILDLRERALVKSVSDDLDDLIQKSLKRIRSQEFVLSIYFGQNISIQYARLAKELHKLFQAPFLRARFVHNGRKWEVFSIRTIPFKEVPEHHLPYLENFAIEYFKRKRYDLARPGKYIYDLAILVNPDETSPPSNKKALAAFEEAASKLGCYVEFITKEDYNRIGEFDALLIRETTAVNHHTYRMARRAQSEGLAVLDSPDSILKCANKVYLTELLRNAKIPTPKTLVLLSDNPRDADSLGFPCVLKLPDSSFSQGVVKVNSKEEFKDKVKEMLKASDLLIAQEFMPTDYDWRVGILNNEVLFVCRYYMASGHWQIYNWNSKKKSEVEGNFDIIEPADAPVQVLEIALKATRLIGNGLYGVDIKELDGKPFVIEINDNPNIDAGVEDGLLKEEIYRKIVLFLLEQINGSALKQLPDDKGRNKKLKNSLF
ncbi:RimK family protein [Marinilabilia salmonicolor]|uniref:Glutathione synthase/RimK-type ligase-like ATP-grasp enzyme n=1 Tax=Marinilabilia salmonicolor TaxID=989 RepID=A0A368UYM9_9BACT|nr:RimK family protein [Marinilabilia salmonicolor]RCW33899.1 glutathione synthase/RimK-type ligase-like ATP-grasp enzyme [Marinilabilia salmonicolor]